MKVTPIGKKATLAAALQNDECEPHLLDNLGTHRFETQEFRIVAIDPREWFENAKKNGQNIEELWLHFSEGWQRNLVRDFRRYAKELATKHFLVIDGDDLEDGFHRLVAFFKERLEVAYAIDLSQPALETDTPVYDEETGEVNL